MQAGDWSLKERVFPEKEGSALTGSLPAEQCPGLQPGLSFPIDSLIEDSSPTESQKMESKAPGKSLLSRHLLKKAMSSG